MSRTQSVTYVWILGPGTPTTELKSRGGTQSLGLEVDGARGVGGEHGRRRLQFETRGGFVVYRGGGRIWVVWIHYTLSQDPPPQGGVNVKL
eukprot:749801-Hanusia_phi.AAC.1